MTFSNLQCDDRGILLLNGTRIGNYSVMGSGPGRLSLSPDLPDTEFPFTNVTSGTVDSAFALGGENTLTLVVNNVVWDRHEHTRPFMSPSDGTHAGVDAAIVEPKTARPSLGKPPIGANVSFRSDDSWFRNHIA